MKVRALRKRSGCSDSSSFSRTAAGSSLQIWAKEHCSSWVEDGRQSGGVGARTRLLTLESW